MRWRLEESTGNRRARCQSVPLPPGDMRRDGVGGFSQQMGADAPALDARLVRPRRLAAP